MADEELGGTQAPDSREEDRNRRFTGARKLKAEPEAGPRVEDEQTGQRNALTRPVGEVDDRPHETDGVDQRR